MTPELLTLTLKREVLAVRKSYPESVLQHSILDNTSQSREDHIVCDGATKTTGRTASVLHFKNGTSTLLPIP